jgi:urea ABC transporter permease protein UrtC
MPPTTASLRRRETGFVVALGFLLVAGLPALNAAGLVGDPALSLLGRALCAALLAVSVDLLWGYAGLLSLGQALFFAMGSYLMALHLTARAGATGSLTDFLAAQGLVRLPDWWRIFAHLPVALIAVCLLPAFVALVFGFLVFRSRISGIYFAVVTQALAAGVMVLLYQRNWLGGRAGLSGFAPLLGADLRSPSTQRVLFICTALTLLVAYAACRWLLATNFGLVLRALREGENRVLFRGYASSSYKLFAFVLAAGIAGIGGALYAPQAGSVDPSEFAPDRSIEAIVWVAVGGRGTLIGPILAAIGLSLLKSWVLQHHPDLWLALLGGLFVFSLVLLPEGVIGLFRRAGKLAGKTGDKPASSQPTVAPVSRD